MLTAASSSNVFSFTPPHFYCTRKSMNFKVHERDWPLCVYVSECDLVQVRVASPDQRWPFSAPSTKKRKYVEFCLVYKSGTKLTARRGQHLGKCQRCSKGWARHSKALRTIHWYKRACIRQTHDFLSLALSLSCSLACSLVFFLSLSLAHTHKPLSLSPPISLSLFLARTAHIHKLSPSVSLSLSF